LQNAIYELVKDKKGSVVVLDASNGEVLSALSFPSYDINLFTTGMPRSEWNELKKNEDKPFTNRIIHSLYNPGKTLYPLVAYSFLQNGIDAEQKIECEKELKLGERIFKVADNSKLFKVNLKDALLHKCNYYFYKNSLELGIDRLSDTMGKFNIGHKANIDLPNEFSGVLPNTSWKEKAYNMPWYQGETIMTSVGKDYILVTPLQIASYMATVASNKYTQPHLFKNTVKQNKHLFLNQSYLEYIRGTLYDNLNTNPYYENTLKNKKLISGVIDTIEQYKTTIFAVYTNDHKYVVTLVLEEEKMQDSFEVFNQLIDLIIRHKYI
jgi:penicillin-binding protein 2